MAKKQGELAEVILGFDYSQLGDSADKVHTSADKIRDLVRNTLENIIQVGQELLGVKDALPHGQFLPWLKAEFGWSERTAQNFMSVAEAFGPKSAIIADLKIAPTAAYLLAGPSVPDEARQEAIEKAEAGEQITVATAKGIVKEARKKGKPKKPKQLPAEKLGVRLIRTLGKFRVRWKSSELSQLAQLLREFADGLDKGQRGSGKKGKE